MPQPPADPPDPRQQRGNGLSALFDLRFERSVTTSAVRTVYVSSLVLTGLVYVVIAINLFAAEAAPVGVLWLLVLGPLAAFVWITILRIVLEGCLALSRLASEDGRSGRGPW